MKKPIKRVKAPRVSIKPIEPVSFADIIAMLDACEKDFTGRSDQAILLTLLNTGARAKEFCDLNLEDVELASGSALIRQGKGRKPHVVSSVLQPAVSTTSTIIRGNNHPNLFTLILLVSMPSLPRL